MCMKKTAVFMILACVMLTFTMAGQEVAIKDGVPFWYAAMDFQGSFKNMAKNIGAFMNEFFKQGLQPGGALMGVYFNNPRDVKEEELKWSIGFPVTKDADVKEPLKKIEFNYKKVAVYLHTGPYEKLHEAYDKIFKHAETKGYKIKWPTYDKYLNNSNMVKPEELKTEITVPLEPK